MTAAFVFTASCLITDGAEEMDVDISRMRAFIATHQDDIQMALGSALKAMPEKRKKIDADERDERNLPGIFLC